MVCSSLAGACHMLLLLLLTGTLGNTACQGESCALSTATVTAAPFGKDASICWALSGLEDTA